MVAFLRDILPRALVFTAIMAVALLVREARDIATGHFSTIPPFEIARRVSIAAALLFALGLIAAAIERWFEGRR